jgi:hypothetical protein
LFSYLCRPPMSVAKFLGVSAEPRLVPPYTVGPFSFIIGCSWTSEESKVESSEHQDNSNIHYQPFPESVSEEHEIYADYDGDHRHHVKHDSYLSAHFSLPVTSDATTDLGLGICLCRAITFTPLAMLLIPLSKPRLRTWPCRSSPALAYRGLR